MLLDKYNLFNDVIKVCHKCQLAGLGIHLERNSLELIYEESLLVSLRFLSVFLRFSEYVREESIRKIKKILEQHPNLSNSKIIQEVESFYLGINYTVILAMLYKIAFSLGSAKGRDIYIKVTESNGKPSLCLIQEIIELQFEKKLDFNKIEKLHAEFLANLVCDRLLKHIILRHCYMHDIGFRDRQKLANKLNIPIQVQRSILIASKTTQD